MGTRSEVEPSGHRRRVQLRSRKVPCFHPADNRATRFRATTGSFAAMVRDTVDLDGWQVALLRGVNVGGGKSVPMAKLASIVRECGYSDARTLLNSGNVIYRAPRVSPAAAGHAIREALASSLGVDTPVMVRMRSDLERIVAENPMPEEAASAPSRFLVMLWDDRFGMTARALIEEATVADERFVIGTHAVYCWLPHGISKSKPFELLGRQLKDTVTSRNWNTMTKLLAMMEKGT
jgi:uncharacterized protein (DUF1697 family)